MGRDVATSNVSTTKQRIETKQIQRYMLKYSFVALLSVTGMVVYCSHASFIGSRVLHLLQSLANVIIDQRKLLFIKKIRTCDNSVIRSFSAICTHEYGKILSKYSIHNLCSGVAELKRSL